MEIRHAKIVAPVRIFRAMGVSNEYGSKVMAKLEAQGRINPQTNSAGRTTLSFDESECLAGALVK